MKFVSKILGANLLDFIHSATILSSWFSFDKQEHIPWSLTLRREEQWKYQCHSKEKQAIYNKLL